jgi:hypothetical protein
MTVDTEFLVASPLAGTDRVLVRRGAGPLDFTIEAVDPQDVADLGAIPGGSANQLQANDGAGGFVGMSGAENEGGQLRLPVIATPTTPAASGLKLYGADFFGQAVPAWVDPDGKVHLVQSDLGDFSVNRFQPAPSLNSIVGENSLNLIAIGTAAASPIAVINFHQMIPRTDFLISVAATTAIAGLRTNGGNARFLRIGKDANAPGGFLLKYLWGPATGVATTTNRAFCGVSDATAAPTDVEPSTRLNIVGMGWDAADTNVQILHNDGSGAATKIDLGASFPVPTVDRTTVYELQLFSPNSLTQEVKYRVIRYNTTDKTIAAEASGTLTTNLPTVTTMLGLLACMSVGGTLQVIGVSVMGILIARPY